MKVVNFWVGAALASCVTASALESQTPTPQVQAAADPLTYADLADLALEAPVTAHVRLARADRLPPEEAKGLKAGRARFYVEADTVSLIRGPAGFPARVRYLVDLPLGADGKPPRLRRKSEHLLFAATVPGRPDELKLAAPDAQLPWTAGRASRVRAILTEGLRADAPPLITSVSGAFHVPGSLPGESETQIFLQTAGGRPVSLSILRRPGEAPQWAVALGEIVDEAAGVPQPDSLLWYRLACGLPRALPQNVFAETEPSGVPAIRADYSLVLEQLGPCRRSRPKG